jgi:hypothetical protein
VEEEAAAVRETIANVSSGSTLYGESKRLNESAVPSPGWHFKSDERKHGRSWSPTTVAGIVHQLAYSGTHEVKIGGEDTITREVPVIVDGALQERAQAVLAENKRYPNRKNDRKYLLYRVRLKGTAFWSRAHRGPSHTSFPRGLSPRKRERQSTVLRGGLCAFCGLRLTVGIHPDLVLLGLLRCEICGYACTGRTSSSAGRKYSYYGCISNRADRKSPTDPTRIPANRGPSINAAWLEDLVWHDIRGFLEDPGDTLERVREQFGAMDEPGS